MASRRVGFFKMPVNMAAFLPELRRKMAPGRQAVIMSISSYVKTPRLALIYAGMFLVAGFHKATMYARIAENHVNLAWHIQPVPIRRTFLLRLRTWEWALKSEDCYLALLPLVTSDISYVSHVLIVAGHAVLALINRMQVMSLVDPPATSIEAAQGRIPPHRGLLQYDGGRSCSRLLVPERHL
ncbi:hypothetical protein MTO96_004943 [Rhipicephalus appendiculatus]